MIYVFINNRNANKLAQIVEKTVQEKKKFEEMFQQIKSQFLQTQSIAHKYKNLYNNELSKLSVLCVYPCTFYVFCLLDVFCLYFGNRNSKLTLQLNVLSEKNTESVQQATTVSTPEMSAMSHFGKGGYHRVPGNKPNV